MMEEIHSIFAAGAGAVSKFVDFNHNSDEKRTIERFFNQKYPYEYLKAAKEKQSGSVDSLSEKVSSFFNIK
jgi:hypothetical protein